MGLYKGSDGQVLWGGGSTDLESTGWTLETRAELVESTELGSAFKQYTMTLKDWSATVEINQYTETSPLTTFNQTSASLKLYIDSNNYFSGNGICTSYTSNSVVDGVTTATLTFVGSDQDATITFT